MPAMLLTAAVAVAENPVVQTCFTTDPAPMVYNDTLYLYTGHDEAGADFFWMQEWRVYSTADMVNWTDHGSPLAIEDFSWGDDRAWAPQCVERNGKFYFYVPLHSKVSGTMAIGVAVGDSPVGPFKDALGKPLYDGSWDHIDPTVFVDDDGRAYIYWGNPNIYYAELNDDMISFKSEVKVLEQTEDSFGAPSPKNRVKGKKYKDTYTEGPWFYKRGDKYYLLYAAGGVPEHIAYSMSDSPWGRGNIWAKSCRCMTPAHLPTIAVWPTSRATPTSSITPANCPEAADLPAVLQSSSSNTIPTVLSPPSLQPKRVWLP